VGALALWLAAGVWVVTHPATTLAASVLTWVATATVSLAVLAFVPNARGERKPTKAVDTFGWRGLLSRAAGAGAIVGLSVVLARVAGPVLGGLASVFPSGWITTMVILTRNHGADFTGATVRVMIAGSLAPVLFGVVCALAFPAWGVVLGTLAGIGVALLASGGVMLALRAIDASSS
jgi:hypothetical protein